MSEKEPKYFRNAVCYIEMLKRDHIWGVAHEKKDQFSSSGKYKDVFLFNIASFMKRRAREVLVLCIL